MELIRLHRPVSTSDRLERLNLFPDRHLGEEEFDRIQDYVDARLQPLLAASRSGIVRGLEVDLDTRGVDAESFTVRQGFALAGNGRVVGLYAPIRRTWQGLIEDYLQTGADSAAGVFYLILRRPASRLDAGPAVDACQRAEADPLRDTRWETVGTVQLRRLAIAEEAVATSTREQIENWVAADRVDAKFLRSMGNAVPLGLLGIERGPEMAGEEAKYKVSWFSQAAARYLAVPNSGYLVLLSQVNEAFMRIMADAEDPEKNQNPTSPLLQYLQENLKLDYLPAAGQLPLELLQNRAEMLPALAWLPPHIGIDMVPVPEEAVPELIERHLARRVVDMRQPAGDRLRLLLAVNEPDYQQDLLDFPQTDVKLERDLFGYFQRAHDVWLYWRQQFDRLYYLKEADVLTEDQVAALALPESTEAPQRAEDVFQGLIEREMAERNIENMAELPLPYRDGAPESGCEFRLFNELDGDVDQRIRDFKTEFQANKKRCAVLVIRGTSDSKEWIAGFSDDGDFRTVVIDDASHALSLELRKPGAINVSRIVELAIALIGRTHPVPPSYLAWLVDGEPPPVPEAQDNGLVIQYALTRVDMERIDNQIRALRSRLEKTRDYLLLQRQQLDSQTVSFAALAGGVAGDGAGLQVARWLPFTALKKTSENPSSSGGNPGSESTTVSGASVSRTAITGFSRIGEVPTSTELLRTSRTALPRTATAAKPSSATRLPARASAVEFGLNRERLDRLKAAPKQAVTKPAFEAKEQSFGVLEHIRPEVKEYKMAYRAMAELTTTVDGLFDRADAKKLKDSLKKFGALKAPEDLDAPDGAAGCELRLLSEPASTFEQRIKDFETEFAAKKQECAVLVVRVSDKDTIWIAGFDDGGVFRRVEIANPSDELSSELSKETIDESRVIALAKSRLGRKAAAGEGPWKGIQERYSELFRAGQILTKQIALVESRYNKLEAQLEQKLRERVRTESALDKLAALITEARQRLDSIDKVRIERLGDYSVARQLVDEDWQRVEREFERRARILTTELRGLYYVRVRPTPVSAALPDPLELRHGKVSDIVPGCDSEEDPELPEDLSEFFDAVLEVPMSDWSVLRPLQMRMPFLHRIAYLFELRKSRFMKRRSIQPAGVFQRALGARLQALFVQNQSVLQQLSARPLPTGRGSLKRFYRDSAQVLSLEDVLTGTSGRLRREAQQLRDKLEQCIACLLENLKNVPPSVRLQWAQLAEDDRLRVEQVQSWPGLERAEREEFNVVRTVAELVAWWFRQLDSEASGAGRAAMRNAIRACLIAAASGDPSEILHGQVQLPPRRLRVGEPLRIRLNRTVPPGTRLQLLDDNQRLVGMVSVDDQDDRGTIANVLRVDRPGATVSTRFTVVASKMTRRRLR